MTKEGIIQKIFKEHERCLLHGCPIMQDLITEIKRDCSPDTPYYESMITRRRLIGDIE